MEKKNSNLNIESHSDQRSVNPNVSDQINSPLLERLRSPSTRNLDIETKQQISAMSIAQNKWMQQVKNWSTTDEIQKAQLEWIDKFSSFPNFNVINSPMRPASWTLPFSPPRSSSDVSPRRGFCVYEPGMQNKVLLDNTTNTNVDNINEVKIAQLEEPQKVIKNTPEKTSPINAFSPFTNTRTPKVEVSERKRHVTVRRKLQLKREEDQVEKHNVETSSSKPACRTEEDRFSARKYIHRKRVERERLLREKRELEQKAEKEQKSRLEHLKETQHRILAHSIKKPIKQTKKKNDDFSDEYQQDKKKSLPNENIFEEGALDVPESTAFNSPMEWSKSPSKPEQIKPLTPPRTPSFGWIQDENIPPYRKKSSYTEYLSLGDNQENKIGNVSTARTVTSSKNFSLSEIKTSSESSSSRMTKSLPLEMPKNIMLQRKLTSSESLAKETSSESINVMMSSEHSATYSTIRNTTSHESFSSSYPMSRETVSGKNQTMEFSNEAKEDLVDASQMFSSEALRKVFIPTDAKATKTYKTSFSTFPPSENLSSNSQYNILAAISNKKSVLKDLQEESQLKDVFSNLEDPKFCLSVNSKCSEVTGSEKIPVIEKGTQVEEDEMELIGRIKNRLGNLSNIFDSEPAQIKQLHKPSMNLLSEQFEEASGYTPPTTSSFDVNLIDTIPDRLSVDPVAKLTLDTRQMLPEIDFVSKLARTKSLENISAFEASKKDTIGNDERLLVFDTMSDHHIQDNLTLPVENATAMFETCASMKKLSFSDDLESVLKNSTVSNVSIGFQDDDTVKKLTSESFYYNIQENDSSFMNFAKFSLNMFIDLLREESIRSKQLESNFKMRENSIVDKIKAEIAYLELEKKKFKVMENEEGVRNVRKKIRGLIMKLQQYLSDLQQVKKMEKSAYKERRRVLLEKIDLLKDQLKKHMDTEKKAKDSVNDSSTSFESTIGLFKDFDIKNFRKTSNLLRLDTPLLVRNKDAVESEIGRKQKMDEEEKIKELNTLIKDTNQTEQEINQVKEKMVERGTSPLQFSFEDNKQEDYSFSGTVDQLSKSSSKQEKLVEKDARKMTALKIPLPPRITLKRRYSSGSDESLLLSQTETLSDASDMETRVLALQQQLKQRKSELESLHKEYKKSQRERLIAKEQSLLSQIQAYDLYIDQVKKELDKEKNRSDLKMVKPVIKHPKVYCDRRKSDTWLLHEKKQMRSNTSIEKSLQLSSRDDLVMKNDKFLDNKELEKFTLRTDFPVVLDDSSREVNVDHSEVLPKPLPTISSDSLDKIEIDCSIIEKHNQSSIVPEVNVQVSENSQIVSKDSVSTSHKDLDQLEDVKLNISQVCLSNSIDDKIDFYEKLSDTSISSAENTSVTTAGKRISKRKSSIIESLISEQEINVQKSTSITSSVYSEEDKDYSDQLSVSNSGNELKSIEKTFDKEEVTKIIKQRYSQDSYSQSITINSSSVKDSKDSQMESHVSEVMSQLAKPKNSEDNSKINNESSIIIADNKSNRSNIETLVIIDDHELSRSNNETSVVIEEDHKIRTDSKHTSEEESSNQPQERGTVELEYIDEDSAKEVTELLTDASAGENTETEDIVPNPNERNTEILVPAQDDSILKEENAKIGGTEINSVDEMINIAQTSSIANSESIIDEVVTVINSEESFSGTSFPLPTNNKKEILSEVTDTKKSIDSEEAHKENITDNSVTEKESENILTEINSQAQQSLVVSVPLDISDSHLEEINTENCHDQSSSVRQTDSEVEESLQESISEQLNSNSISGQSNNESFENTVEGDREVDENQNISVNSINQLQIVDNLSDEDTHDITTSSNLSKEVDDYEGKTSFIDDKDDFGLLDSGRRDGRGAAPLIDALQREGDSSIDQIWRGIADDIINDATNLVLSVYNKRERIAKRESQEVGDSDEDEFNASELQCQQAAEAEKLRLQQLRIDKEIEELEEEERRYYYIRPIPDKPPPPYTPRRSSLVSSVVEAASEIWDGRTETPSTFMSGCHLREFLWDLALELVSRVRPNSPPPQPPWIHILIQRPKRQIRNKDELLEEVEKEAKIYLGLEERECRENLIIRWSRKRRDHVDEILVKESQEEEWQWTDYSEEESIIKNRIADTIIAQTLKEATGAIAQAFIKKFSS